MTPEQAPWWVAIIIIPTLTAMGYALKLGVIYIRDTIEAERNRGTGMTERLITMQEKLLANAMSERQAFLTTLDALTATSKDHTGAINELRVIEERIISQNNDILQLLDAMKDELVDLRLVQASRPTAVNGGRTP